jgi:rhodanese-related sulfurtransferase
MCASGLRSYVAQQILLRHGWDDVRNLTGGWNMLEQVRATTVGAGAPVTAAA